MSIDTIGNVNRDFKKKQWSELISQLNKFILLREQKGHQSALDIKTILEENIEQLFEIHKLVTETLKADTQSSNVKRCRNSTLRFDV